MGDHSRAPGGRLRYAIIGCGASVAPLHLEALAKLPVSLVAMCDIDARRGASRAAQSGCAFYTDHRAMLSELALDVAVICTPHPAHTPIAIDCFRAGAHVLLEKPMAESVDQADRTIVEAARAGRVLGVNFPERFRPAVETARAMLARGELGQLVRVLAVEPWLRTAAYYQSSRWRGTWQGEGGGVLLNQGPHTLDVLSFLLGNPARVWGMTRTRAQPIECEDSAQAMLEYPSGALGYVAVSTVEGGTDKRLEIAGDRAVLTVVGDQLQIRRFDRPLREQMASGTGAFRLPPARVEVIDATPLERGFHAVHADFMDALAEGRPPCCDGASALLSLELANAIVLSSFRERPVTLPLDRAAYAEFLAEKRAGALARA